ncbi:hypothetical protein FKM82_014969 [Ascaphus truei]
MGAERKLLLSQSITVNYEVAVLDWLRGRTMSVAILDEGKHFLIKQSHISRIIHSLAKGCHSTTNSGTPTKLGPSMHYHLFNFAKYKVQVCANICYVSYTKRITWVRLCLFVWPAIN